MDRGRIELFYEPLWILDVLSDGYKTEMTKEQLAFLCGLIKKYQPKKIVEIGVAAGGTTSVMLNCLSILGLNTQLFSIDVSSEYYRDKSKKTGYLIEECEAKIKGKVEHILCTGQVSVKYLDIIQKGIDMLILDTVHCLPGEILDFLACYPFLKEGSIVVLHDIAVNHYGSNAYAFATKLLWDTVSAEKYLEIYDNNFPNIGAFMINYDTDKSIENIFSALTITWHYMPEDQELSLYRTFYKEYYTEENIRLFDMAVQLNRKTINRNAQIEKHIIGEVLKEVVGWHKFIINKKIYIYGCGNFGKKLHDWLQNIGIEVSGYIISDDQRKIDLKENVFLLSEINLNENKDVIFIGVSSSFQAEICAGLQKKKFTNYIVPSEKLFATI